METMQLEAPYAWAIYSTHKHKASAPRFRLIAPLSRAVDPDEYEAITRKMAEEIGLEYFDSTTFQPSRLMYWPSCSRDAEFVFEYNDGKPVDADAWLNKYPDWRDVTFWPVCPDEIRVQKKRQEKQQDPLKKKGPVGTPPHVHRAEAIGPSAGCLMKAPARMTATLYAALGGLSSTTTGCSVIQTTARIRPTDGSERLRPGTFTSSARRRHRRDTPATKRCYKEMIELIRQLPAASRPTTRRHAAAADDFAGG
ncbi:MAG: hypothetical protein ACLRTA_02460 [Clostridia bacterium]